jgi:PAS domain S-box-containing protein
MSNVFERLRSNPTLEAFNKSMALIEFDMKGNVLSANENFCKAIGYDLTAIKGKHHSMFVDPLYRETSEYTKFWDNRPHSNQIYFGGKMTLVEVSSLR